MAHRDPHRGSGGVNLYGYMGGNPLGSSDPLGLCPPGYDPVAGQLTKDANDANNNWSNYETQAANDPFGSPQQDLDSAYAQYWQNKYYNLIGQDADPGKDPGAPPQLATPGTPANLPQANINWPDDD